VSAQPQRELSSFFSATCRLHPRVSAADVDGLKVVFRREKKPKAGGFSDAMVLPSFLLCDCVWFIEVDNG